MSRSKNAPPLRVVRSAGDQEWREIRLSIYPNRSHARFALSVRRHRGSALVWERRLCAAGTDDVSSVTVGSVTGVLRAVAVACHELAERLDAGQQLESGS